MTRPLLDQLSRRIANSYCCPVDAVRSCVLPWEVETVTHDADADLYLRTICCFDNGILALELVRTVANVYQFSRLNAFLTRLACPKHLSRRKTTVMPQEVEKVGLLWISYLQDTAGQSNAPSDKLWQFGTVNAWFHDAFNVDCELDDAV
jgi:hypothetical protein